MSDVLLLDGTGDALLLDDTTDQLWLEEGDAATGGSNYTTPVQGPYFSPGFSPANPPLIGIL